MDTKILLIVAIIAALVSMYGLLAVQKWQRDYQDALERERMRRRETERMR